MRENAKNLIWTGVAELSSGRSPGWVDRCGRVPQGQLKSHRYVVLDSGSEMGCLGEVPVVPTGLFVSRISTQDLRPGLSSAVPGGTLFLRLAFLQHAGFFGRAQTDEAIDGIRGPVR